MIPFIIAGAIGYGIAKLLEEDKAPKYADGGGTLLAPNGKPSNLTPEQYKLVRTPEFKAWFGDWQNDPENASKVVDENGEPLVVYHGTNAEFNEFKPSVKALASHTIRTQPIFLSPNLQFANAYGKNIKSTFLNIRKLFYGRKLNQEQEDYFYELILNDEIKKGTNEDSAIEHAYQTTRELKLGSWGVLESDFMWNFYKQYDYNGFIVDEGYENYAVFNSNQIKLADGTNTTFDGNNPDIRYAGGGEITLLKNKAKSPFLGKLYGQDVEPSGYYAIEKKTNMFDSNENYETKKLKYQNPLYIDVDTDTLISWKYELSNKYKAKGKQLTEKLIKEGYDVIITKYPNGDLGEIIVLDTLKLKNNDIRYKTGGEIKDLVVLHNINSYQIKEADYLGGLITPSIAILKAGQSFTDFGSITLIGTKELIDPENRSVKVFAGDVYSPSVPRRLWYVDNRTLEKVTNELKEKSLYYDENISNSNREFYHLINRYIGNSSEFDKDIEKNSFNKLIEQYFEKLKLIYIVDKSIKIKVPFKDKRHFLWNNAEFTLTPEQKKRFAPILREYTNESNENGSNGTSEEIRSKVYDLFLEVLNNIKLDIQEKYKNEKDGDKLYEIISNKMFESFEKTVGTRYDWREHYKYDLSQAVWSEKLLDEEKLNQNIKKVFTKDVIEDYKKWLSDFISQFQGRAYFLKGNEKMSYNLENLVDATSNRVVGQEKNITFSVNQAKSFGTKRLNSINEIKKNSNKLISKQEMNLIDEKNSDNFSMLSQSLKYEDENTWRKLDSLGKALADYFKGTSIVSALRKNDFKTPSSYQITLFEDFADELKNSPVDYFEGKYQRAVSLNEFKYAVVPFDTDTKTIDILRSNKLIVKKYKTDDERFQIVNNISEKDKSIKFNNGGRLIPTFDKK